MNKINLGSIAEKGDILHNSQIAIIEDIRKLYDPSAPKQFLAECYVFGIVLQGNAHIIIDNVEYELERGDTFGFTPRNILERSMISFDLKILGFVVTPEYTSKLLQNVHVDWSFLMMPNTHEVIHTDEEEMERMVDYCNLLRKKLVAEDSPYKQESIDMLIQSMGLEIMGIRDRKSECCHKTAYSSAEHIVQQFMMMLTESSQKGLPYLNVNGYADRLNVSPKYFSQVCKNILGKTASDIINADIMNTATALLHDNSLSIKQISDRLGFANQSHFGTFFRRHSNGMSPQTARTSVTSAQ